MTSAYNEPTLEHTYKVLRMYNDTVNNVDNVVLVIIYYIIAVDEEGNEGKLEKELRFDRGSPLSDNFIPFDQLDEETVIGWIKSSFSPTDKYHHDMMLHDALRTAKESKYDKTIPWLNK